MKKIYLWLLVIGLILGLCSPAYAGWKERIAKNQAKAIHYILKLKEGANPDRISRPSLRRDNKARAKSANREINKAITRAEQLARKGYHEQIEIPEFQVNLVSKDSFNRLLNESSQ